MLDIRTLRDDVEQVIELLNRRGNDFSYLREVVEMDKERRDIISKVEEMKAFRNAKSKEVGMAKAKGLDAADILAEVATIGDQIQELDIKLGQLDAKIQELLLKTPNVPRETTPVGKDENDNIEVKVWGKTPQFNYEPKAHWDIATGLDIIDFERAAKITGSRFALYKGFGARLERAVAQFMLDTHADVHGYTEVIPPYIVNSNSLKGTGQLPKFEEDLFRLKDTDYYLIPTAEVPVTNVYANEIIDVTNPVNFVAFSPCFRAEAGSAGRDTRGIIRQHQFHKVELVKFTRPEESYNELEKLTGHAERILELLELPYRKIELCTGDMGFSAKKTYDLEVWLPSYNSYKEISSCSNFEDFQARRANIRFKNAEGKTEFVHTLNGSGLAVGRTVAAILENYQQADGTVIVPKVLVKYMGTEIIK